MTILTWDERLTLLIADLRVLHPERPTEEIYNEAKNAIAELRELDRNKMSFSYSDEQKNKIFEACAPLDASEADNAQLIQNLYRTLNIKKLKIDWADHRQQQLKELKMLIGHIDAIDETLAPKLDEWDICEGIAERPKVADYYEPVKPYLDELGNYLKQSYFNLANLETLSPREYEILFKSSQKKETKNAEKVFKREFFAVVGERWESLGGEVNQKKEFRAFFEAITLPVLRNKKVQRLKKVTSSHLTPLRNKDLAYFYDWWKKLNQEQKRRLAGFLN